jgi:hypothetical protein
MKKIFILMVIGVFAFGCKKENKTPVPSNNTKITGNWELRLNYGGIAGITTHYSAGTGPQLQLNSDSTFLMRNQSTVTNHGTFSIVKQGITLGTTKYDAIYFNHSSNGEIIQLKPDTLTIGIDYDDGFASVYIRK